MVVKLTRIYACRGGACEWEGPIDDMPIVQCPLCDGGHLEYVGDAVASVEDMDAGRTVFNSRRTRDREAEVDDKSEKKRPGIFERIAGKTYFRRTVR